MSKRKFFKKKAKKYFSPFSVLLVVLLTLLVVYEKTAQEPEVSYELVELEIPIKVEEIKGSPFFEPFKVEEKPFSEKSLPPPIKETSEMIGNQYLIATFSDSFTSTAWLNTDLLTLHLDNIGTNLTFPPQIEINEVVINGRLDNFVSEKVVSNQKEILFLGYHRLTKQRQIFLWRPTELGAESQINPWSEYDFTPIGFDQATLILKIIPPFKNKTKNWLFFSQANGNVKINQIDFTVTEAKSVNSQILDIAFAQEIQIVCAAQHCLFYNPSSLQFWEVNIQTQKVKFLSNLSEMMGKKDPEQVVVININGQGDEFPGCGSEDCWAIGWVKNQQFEIAQYTSQELKTGQPIFILLSQSAKYPGRLVLSSLAHEQIFVLWASYYTRAYKIDTKSRVIDLSSKFGWRISKEQGADIYEFSQAIYIKNEDGSIIRFNGEVNTQVGHLFWLKFNSRFSKFIPWQFEPEKGFNGGYVVAGVPDAGTKIYQFIDQGFDLSGIRQVVSKKVNFSVAQVAGAQISGLESDIKQALIEYYLSNDGGKTWQKANLGQMFIFENPGNDLRWKIIIIPFKQALPDQTPYLRSINLTYWYKK
ncbi:hypothetical protein IID20_02465 [Patescibacteria group bacterium]|nr:hypothetical protein [Patescibacteria group bacterium]